MYFPLIVGALCLFCYALLCVDSSFAIILKRKRNLVALLLLSYRCIITLNVLWFFLAVLWVGSQCVIAVFPDHTHFFESNSYNFSRIFLKLCRCFCQCLRMCMTLAVILRLFFVTFLQFVLSHFWLKA